MFRILVAEDDDNARFLMCEVLRRAGYEPCPARDGVEALEVMEHYQCDLAVVDITMPRMDGIKKHLIAVHQKLIKGHRVNCHLIDLSDREKEFVVIPCTSFMGFPLKLYSHH